MPIRVFTTGLCCITVTFLMLFFVVIFAMLPLYWSRFETFLRLKISFVRLELGSRTELWTLDGLLELCFHFSVVMVHTAARFELS